MQLTDVLSVSLNPLVGVLTVTALDSVPFFPGTATAIAAGTMYGFGLGLLVILTGQLVATVVCVWIGRRIIGKERAEHVFGRRAARALEHTFEGRGSVWKKVVVLRLSPVIPFSISNYVLGAATALDIKDILLGTVVGVTPLDAVYVATGALVAAGAESAQSAHTIAAIKRVLLIVGGAATTLICYCGAVALRDAGTRPRAGSLLGPPLSEDDFGLGADEGIDLVVVVPSEAEPPGSGGTLLGPDTADIGAAPDEATGADSPER